VLAMVIALYHTANQKLPYTGGNQTWDDQELKLLTLDDGTSTVNILVPDSMISKGVTCLGETIECFMGLRQQGTVRNWYAKACFPVTDPHAELLRWMELTVSGSLNLGVDCNGYLTAKCSSNNMLRLLSLQVSKAGASLEDLGAALQVPIKELQEQIVDLQLSGQIYQNHEGKYALL
jgi:hypothetical protein